MFVLQVYTDRILTIIYLIFYSLIIIIIIERNI